MRMKPHSVPRYVALRVTRVILRITLRDAPIARFTRNAATLVLTHAEQDSVGERASVKVQFVPVVRGHAGRSETSEMTIVNRSQLHACISDNS